MSSCVEYLTGNFFNLMLILGFGTNYIHLMKQHMTKYAYFFRDSLKYLETILYPSYKNLGVRRGAEAGAW